MLTATTITRFPDQGHSRVKHLFSQFFAMLVGILLSPVLPVAAQTTAPAGPSHTPRRSGQDVYRKPLTWRGSDDIGVAEGSPVILRFRLDRAKLFGLEFE